MYEYNPQIVKDHKTYEPEYSWLYMSKLGLFAARSSKMHLNQLYLSDCNLLRVPYTLWSFTSTQQ